MEKSTLKDRNPVPFEESFWQGGENNMEKFTLRDRFKIPDYDRRKDMSTGKLAFDDEKCIRCGICTTLCPGRSVLMDKTPEGEKGLPYLDEIAPDVGLCIACGCCLAACPTGAISIERGFRPGHFYKRLTQPPEMVYPHRYSMSKVVSKFDKRLISKDPTARFNSMPTMPKAMANEIKETIALARKFNDTVVRPLALETDIKTFEDPEYLPWELVEKANEWGFYTMFIPKFVGGQGRSMMSLLYFLEEITSVCVSMANVIGVHYLGMAGILCSWNLPLAVKIFNETAKGERTGKPCIISYAITEPDAGTDVEDVKLVDRGRVTCHLEKVEGGYIVNGTKIFISMGHVSEWCCVTGYTDLKKPSENTVNFAVKTGMEGFSFGRHEKKMGQRASIASELVFEDCFIPDEYVITDASSVKGRLFSMSSKKLTERHIHYVLGGSRPAVAAFGIGIARGAYEEALKFARETEVDGKLLINHEWVQSMLAEMYMNVAIGRLCYLEAHNAECVHWGLTGLIYYTGGLYDLMQWRPLYYLMKYLPRSLVNGICTFFLATFKPTGRLFTWLSRLAFFNMGRLSIQQNASGWASLAKFVSTDAGVKNSQMALELMGQAGLRHDRGMEKILRDGKLLQIYEGTNQLNRINMFECLIERTVLQAKVFDDSYKRGK